MVNPALLIFPAEVKMVLRARSPNATGDDRFGGVDFVHRFGSAFNASLLFHY